MSELKVGTVFTSPNLQGDKRVICYAESKGYYTKDTDTGGSSKSCSTIAELFSVYDWFYKDINIISQPDEYEYNDDEKEPSKPKLNRFIRV